MDLVPTVRPSGRACPPAASSCSPSCGPARLQRFGSPRGARRPGRLRQHFRLLLARCRAVAPRAGGAAPYFSKRLRSWTSKLSRFFVLPLTSCVVRFVAVSLTAASIVNFAITSAASIFVNFHSESASIFDKLRIRSGGKPQTSLDTQLRHSCVGVNATTIKGLTMTDFIQIM